MRPRFSPVLAALLLLAASAPVQGRPAESVRVTLELVPPDAAPGDRVEGRIRFEIAPGYHIYGPMEELGIPTSVKLRTPPGLSSGTPSFPPPRRAHYELLGGDVMLYEKELAVTVPIAVAADVRGDKLAVEAAVTFQPCTDEICERPREGLLVRGELSIRRGARTAPAAGASPAQPDSTAAGPAAATPARATPQPAPLKHDAFRDALAKGLLWALLAAFGWGIAASFSPCVYPMIPITVSYFGSQGAQGSRRKRVGLAAAYVLGMTLTYSVLGLVAAKLGKDLGGWMVNPWVIGSLAVLLVGLACSMFGLYVLRLPPAITNWLNAGDRGGYLEAAFMGLALGFVAAPCVGPFAGSILVFVARSGNILIGFATLFSFGLGMGMLFLVIAFSSESLSKLPRSGQWLVTLEHFFGFVLMGMAIYLLANILPTWLTIWLLGVYLVMGGTFVGAFTPLEGDSSPRALTAKGVGFICVIMGAAAVVAGTVESGVLGGSPLVPASAPAAAAERPSPWLRSLADATAQAKKTGKPIFADFFADWCIPCRLMDRTTFRDRDVEDALSDFVLAKVDCTDPDGPGARYKNEVLHSANMPYLAFFDPNGNPLPADSIEGYTDTPQFLAAVSAVSKRFGKR